MFGQFALSFDIIYRLNHNLAPKIFRFSLHPLYLLPFFFCQRSTNNQDDKIKNSGGGNYPVHVKSKEADNL
jgi:hypothetical protein